MKIPHTHTCPICQSLLEKATLNPNYHRHFQRHQPHYEEEFLFLCINPLAKESFHYYSHTATTSDPYEIIYQEFSMDIGSKHVLFGNNYLQDISMIKFHENTEVLELPFLLIPDFSDLENFAHKIRTSIVFS